MRYKVGFIGCGNMGGTIARNISLSIGGNNVAVCDLDKSKTKILCTEYGTNELNDFDIFENCEYVFLGLKPQFMQNYIKSVINIINGSNCVIISMAAGVSVSSDLEHIYNIKRPIIRIMPNMPCGVGSGMILYSYNKLITSEKITDFLSFMSSCGRLDAVDDALIDAGSAITGCGPAFAYIFAEALADAGVECGLPRDKALLYAAQMLKGSAETLLESPSPSLLKDKVCSPGGTTIAGVHALESSGFRAAVMNAVVASYKKNGALNSSHK